MSKVYPHSSTKQRERYVKQNAIKGERSIGQTDASVGWYGLTVNWKAIVRGAPCYITTN